jgi:hypothetical protein
MLKLLRHSVPDSVWVTKRLNQLVELGKSDTPPFSSKSAQSVVKQRSASPAAKRQRKRSRANVD